MDRQGMTTRWCPKCQEGWLLGPHFYKGLSDWFDRLTYECPVCKYKHWEYTRDDPRNKEG